MPYVKITSPFSISLALSWTFGIAGKGDLGCLKSLTGLLQFRCAFNVQKNCKTNTCILSHLERGLYYKKDFNETTQEKTVEQGQI